LPKSRFGHIPSWRLFLDGRAFAFASEIERGFQPPHPVKPQSGLPLCRRQERSRKGEATDFIAFAFALLFFL
jgi:hypothetical protein